MADLRKNREQGTGIRDQKNPLVEVAKPEGFPPLAQKQERAKDGAPSLLEKTVRQRPRACY
jgi:hypothetical protein